MGTHLCPKCSKAPCGCQVEKGGGVSAGRALVILLSGFAQENRRRNPTYTPTLLHIAERTDKRLAFLMQRKAEAQKVLDDYILSKTG